MSSPADPVVRVSDFVSVTKTMWRSKELIWRSEKARFTA